LGKLKQYRRGPHSFKQRSVLEVEEWQKRVQHATPQLYHPTSKLIVSRLGDGCAARKEDNQSSGHNLRTGNNRYNMWNWEPFSGSMKLDIKVRAVGVIRVSRQLVVLQGFDSKQWRGNDIIDGN
jgi:hypothetical protein